MMSGIFNYCNYCWKLVTQFNANHSFFSCHKPYFVISPSTFQYSSQMWLAFTTISLPDSLSPPYPIQHRYRFFLHSRLDYCKFTLPCISGDPTETSITNSKYSRRHSHSQAFTRHFPHSNFFIYNPYNNSKSSLFTISSEPHTLVN